jgi:DDE_Tnp_1-associated
VGAFEDWYTVALPMEKTSIRSAMVRPPVPCMRTRPACWRGVSLGSLPPRVSSLLEMLAGIRDPRDPRGVRHRLVAVLGVAVVATLAGAANYRELGSVAADLPQELLRLMGACWDRARRRFVAPSAATLRRVLIALDADELDAAVPTAGRSRWTAKICADPGTMTAGWCCSRR